MCSQDYTSNHSDLTHNVQSQGNWSSRPRPRPV